MQDGNSLAPSQRRLERAQSAKGRREHSHHHSHSKHVKEETKPVGEYALHVLFNTFIAQADDKISQCVTTPLDPEPQIERICGVGVDPNFDQLISALGHIAAPKPRRLIDALMLWRKAKSEAASSARNELQRLRAHVGPGHGLPRRNTEPGNPGQMNDVVVPTNPSIQAMQNTVAQAERRSTVSIYILCRVLIEVIGQSTLQCITVEMEEKLEGIIFMQLIIGEIESLQSSPLKLANWHLFSQLLGVMSGVNFAGVTARFLSNLESAQLDLDSRSPSTRDAEGRIELVLGGMKHLRVKIYPESAWDQSCTFMLSLTKLFARCHGQRIKYAYCQILDAILLPIAATASTQLAAPKWHEVLATISVRLGSMMAKPRHWPVAFPVTATVLCVSTPETFSAQWLSLLNGLVPKLKDRLTRATSLQVISRLLWTYLYRCKEPTNVVFKKLDEVVRLVLPSAKKAHSGTDSSVIDALIEIIRIIGFKHPDFCFSKVIFPLVNYELFAPNKDVHTVRVDQLEPEKMVIGIRAFLAIMTDLEQGEAGRPPFPQSYKYNLQSERVPASPIMSSPRLPSLQMSCTERADTLHRPVALSSLSNEVQAFYKQFCAILGKITIICDETFGGQAVLDEKFAATTPKTPIAETFNFRRDDLMSLTEHKHGYYELLHVAVQALPRCLSADIPFNSLINLLCTGTAHVQNKIAESSAQSIKSIARQSHAQQVTIGFARFIFSFDDKYSTMSDGGMLGPIHVENTLKLYVELLHIWIDEIKQRFKDAAASRPEDQAADKRAAPLDNAIWAHVEEVEAHGLFFLCSQSRRVRSFAITVLKLVTEFDAALGMENVRLIHILESESASVMDFNDELLSVAERSRLQRSIKKDAQAALIELCRSDVSYDTTLWFKLFPNLIKTCYSRSPITVALGRELICNRILQMYKGIVNLADSRSAQFQYEMSGSRMGYKAQTTPPSVMVEQWKLYLIVACTTLTDKGLQQPAAVPVDKAQHLRHGSRAKQSQQKIGSANSLFKYILPLLEIGADPVREAVVIALGSININIYKTLLQELQSSVNRCSDDAKARIGIHHRTISTSRRNRKTETLRTEITQVYHLTAHFLREETIYNDDSIMSNLVKYVKDLKLFLMDAEVQNDWEFQKLRRHYCGLMEQLFQGINRTKEPSRWMTFETRKSSFHLMEDWCGYSPNQEQILQREAKMRLDMINGQMAGEQPTLNAQMEKEKKSLQTAALKAMAALCAGPISIITESGANLGFDVRRMLLWLDTIFGTENDKMHVIGKRALVNLITHNKEHPYLLEHSISRCYYSEAPKQLQSYFEVVTQILLEHADYQVPFYRVLGIGLSTLGSDQSIIRSKSAAMLRTLEERQQRNSKIQDFDISISDKTKAVYKLAQFEISKRLAERHSECAFYLFSEFTVYFKSLKPMDQQNMVAAILPWIQRIELQVDPNGGPTAQSYVLLANLFEITIKSSSVLHNEVQGLWQALATGGHDGNVQLVLDFIMSLCLDRREQNFVEYAKQIVVFLSSTLAGTKVVEFLLLQITPKAMIPNERRDSLPPPPDVKQMPYVADLGAEALPIGAKQAAFSLGQLSLILLVDLMVSPLKLLPQSVPLLLQVVTVLWDHYTPLVQDQAREMLIHLIHELVISDIEDDATTPSKREIEALIEAIRSHDSQVVWAYEDSNGKIDEKQIKVPAGMENLCTRVVDTFQLTYPGIQEQWGKLTLTWATSCPVRHLACRSFQIFRCILTSLDQPMLADMLARLSNTIADEDAEIQTFSMEILTTLRTLISKLDPMHLVTFPQLFWTTCACLDTINEKEFIEALGMLNEFLSKLDLAEPMTISNLANGKPQRWDGSFEGIQPLVYKGLRSSTCLGPTLDIINALVQIPSGDLVGSDDRLLFAILANFPGFLQSMDEDSLDPKAVQNAVTLALVAEAQGRDTIRQVLDAYATSQYRSSHQFLAQLVVSLRDDFFTHREFQTLTFLMGLLTNSIPWFKINTMRILCAVIPEIDMSRPEIKQHGSDIISPILRLLQSEFCMQALEVLDHVMTMTDTAMASMENDHLRMSMAGSRSSKAIRKEFERTQSLFGIPEESGWSIPMPARHAETTRANVHAAFYMCQSSESTDIEPAPTPDVEFHDDQFQYDYFPPVDRADTMMSEEVRPDVHITDLVNKLDSLDDFFEEEMQSPPSDGRSSKTITEFGNDFDTELYEEQTLPILTQSLGHAASASTYQTSFADPYRQPAVNAMNPGAFNLQPMAASRPSMHARSATSPSAAWGVQHSIPDFMSDDEFASEVFSDGDEARRQVAVDGGFFLENMTKSVAAGARSGMRRLTGSRNRENERAREALRAERERMQYGNVDWQPQPAMKSPRVPKVPREYLTQVASPQLPQGPHQQQQQGGGSGKSSFEVI